MSAFLASQLDLTVICKILSMISKLCSKKYLFSSESLKTCENIASNNLEMVFIFLQFIKTNANTKPNIYFNLIFLLSGNISLQPGRPHNSQIDRLSCNVFDKKGLLFLHTNVSRFSPKNEELRFIAKTSEAIEANIIRWNNFCCRNFF